GLSLVSADATSGALRWAHRIPQSVPSPAVLAGPNIVVRDSRRAAGGPNLVLAYRAAPGQPARRLHLPAPAAARPLPPGRRPAGSSRLRPPPLPHAALTG